DPAPELGSVESLPRELATKELNALWGDLAGHDAARAYKSIWKLIEAPTQAVPFLKEKLQPARLPDQDLIVRLIKDLDGRDFEVREKAEQELEKLAEAAEPALRRAELAKPPPETRRRVERLLDKRAK